VALTPGAISLRFGAMKSLLTCCCLAVVALIATAAEPDTRCFEMRTYYAAPGKLDALHARFRDHTMKIFERHGMQNIGYWVPVDNAENKLVYILAFPSRAARDKAFREFGADPEWKEVASKSEANGKLVTRVVSRFMQATDYSPAIKPSQAGAERTFELREYTASAGNLGALDARVLDHTIDLVKKHGMENFGYWHLMPKEKGADTQLIYLLAHKSQDAAAASFAAFRADPEWVKVKEESEKKAGGSLTEGGMAGVKSTFLKPTDYSPTK